jgi:hypothetical protein
MTMRYTHYENDSKIGPRDFATGLTWRTYVHISGGGWYPVKGSLKGTEKESRAVAEKRYRAIPGASFKTVYHADGDERD